MIYKPSVIYRPDDKFKLSALLYMHTSLTRLTAPQHVLYHLSPTFLRCQQALYLWTVPTLAGNIIYIYLLGSSTRDLIRELVGRALSQENKSETRMTARILKRDPNT